MLKSIAEIKNKYYDIQKYLPLNFGKYKGQNLKYLQKFDTEYFNYILKKTDLKEEKINSTQEKSIRFGKAEKKDFYEMPENLFNHQKEVVKRFIDCNYAGLAFDMGTGKTRTAIEIVSHYIQPIVLIVCPKSIIFSTWGKQLEEYYKDDFLFFSLDATSLKTIDKRLERLKYIKTILQNKNQSIFICLNYEGLINEDLLYSLCGVSPDFLIFDESHKIKNHSAKVTKAAHILRSFTKLKNILMTGTPITNHLEDIWSQAYCLDGGLTFGNNFYQFRNKYFYKINMYEFKFNEVLRTEFMQNKNKLFERVERSECLDLPKSFEIIQSITLCEKTSKKYKEAFSDAFIELEDEKKPLQYKIQVLQKCRQLANGFLYDEEKIIEISNEKFEALQDLIESTDEKIIVFAVYRYEIEKIVKEFSACTIDNLNEFLENPLKKVLVLQFDAAEGIDGLQSVCNIGVFYSLSYRYDKFEQAKARLVRQGQNKPVTFYIFEALTHNGKKTIDNAILKTLENKTTMIEDFINNVKKQIEK